MTVTSQRFEIRVEGLFRRLASVFGVRDGSTYVDVGPDALAVKCGFVEARDIPRTSVRSAMVVPWPGRLRIAWRIGPGNTIWLVGVNADCVRVEFDPPQRFRFPPMNWFGARARTLLVSVDDPAGLVAALER